MKFEVNRKNVVENETPRFPERIEVSGEYTGRFADAYFYKTKNGAGMMRFVFNTEGNKETATFNFCIQSKNGTPTFGQGIVDSIMTCLRVREVNSVAAVYTNKRTGEETPIERFPELMDRPIGLLLQRTRDPNKDERWQIGVEIVTPFESGTRFTAKEIMEKATKPEALDIRKKRLQEERMLKLREPAPAQQFESPLVKDVKAVFNPDDDDVPF